MRDGQINLQISLIVFFVKTIFFMAVKRDRILTRQSFRELPYNGIERRSR